MMLRHRGRRAARPLILGCLLLIQRGALAAPALPGAPAARPEPAPELERSGSGQATLAAGTAYLVAPLHNRSGSPGLAWMSAALASTIAENLEGTAGLRPAYGAAPLRGLPFGADLGEGAPAALLRRAREQGATLVFYGEVDRQAWRYSVALRAYRLSDGRLTELARVEARSPSASLGAAVVPQLLQAALHDLLGRLGISEEDRAPALRVPTRDVYAWTLFGRALLAYYGPTAEDDASAARRQELERAEKTLQRVCFIDPRFAAAHRMLGLILQEQGEDQRALGQYAHALDLWPDSFAALWGQAQLYHKAGARARAQEATERALRQRAYDIPARLLLGELLLAGGKPAAAQAELTQVLAARPEQVAARRALAQCYAAQGQIVEMAAELSRVVALVPDDLDARLDLAAGYVRMGHFAQAQGAYEDILRRRPRHAQALRLLGDVQRRLGEPERAAATYQKMLRAAPDDPRAPFLLARALMDAGQDARAERVLSDAQQHRRYLGDAFAMMGVLELRRNDLARASWYLSRAAARPGARPLTHYNYAVVLLRQGQLERAVAELQVAAEQDPQDAELQQALAKAQAALPPRPEPPTEDPRGPG